MTDLTAYEWRVGGHGNCGILALVGYDRGLDPVLGLMNTAGLAAAVVDEHNAAIRGRAKAEGRDSAPPRHRLPLPRRWRHISEDYEAAPDQDAEDVEPRLARPSIAGEETRP